jgi:hypothetical protein
MKNVNGKAIYLGAFARILLFGALAMCMAGSPLSAQDAIAGKFTLNESARLGNRVLGAGRYHFVIEPIGVIQSIRSIQQGAGHLVLVVVKAENSGPTVSTFAMASPSGTGGEGSELVLTSAKQGTLPQAKYLQEEGLMVDLNWSSPKAKTQVAARQGEPRQSTAVLSTTGQ